MRKQDCRPGLTYSAAARPWLSKAKPRRALLARPAEGVWAYIKMGGGVGMSTKSFSARDLDVLAAAKYVYVRAGEHRFIAIWVVVVEGRVLARSWNDKPGGWYRAFLAERVGQVRIGDREVAVRAVPVRSKRIIDAVDVAYGEKYTTKANEKYVKGFGTAKRKATTVEFVPDASG